MNDVARQAARQRTVELRRMVADIREYIENLTVGVNLAEARSSRYRDQTVLRTPAGKLIGQFADPTLADFIRRAPTWLTDLCDRVDQQEHDAYEFRKDRRRLRRVESALRSGQHAATGTPEQRTAFIAALRALDAGDGYGDS